MTDHLKQAKRAADKAAEHHQISALRQAQTDLGTMHALIDIAESLRVLRPPAPPAGQKAFGGKAVTLPPPSDDDDYELRNARG